MSARAASISFGALERRLPSLADLRGYDGILLAAVGFILGLGVVLVYSASSVYALKNYGNAEFFLSAQLRALVVGAAALVVLARVPGPTVARLAVPGFALVTLACAVVLIPGIGHLAGGARRWLVIGPVGVQPSELAKLATLVLVALVLARRERKQKGERHGLLGPVLLAQLPVALILLEPDLGTALVIELVVGAMVFAAGLRLRTLVLLALAALPVLYHLIVGTPFRLQRVLGYIDPWAYRSTIGYQVTEALISIGSGGVTGVGLGEGKHKLFFLPEAHTDFIFAILGEELGFVGVVALLCAFAVVVWRGVRIATRARESFDRYLALGLTGLIGIPALFNVCVATGLLPTKGLPLPLVSYGGSNLLVVLAAVGMLLRIGRDVHLEPRAAKEGAS